jgi:DNA/RNA-binding domain of Phe-tRNA-synthetase-like protein
MLLDVAPDVLDLGLSVCALVMRGVDSSRTPPELVAYRRAVGQRLAAHWKNRSISAHPAIREYHRAHEQVGVTDLPPAPEKLITYVRRNRDFTASGAVVDCYNIVSARTLLSLGAHDLGKLATPVTLRRSTPDDVFVPLGQTQEQRWPGEYSYIDPHRQIICRLEVLQCEATKVTSASRDIVIFLQGNRCLPPAVLLKGAWLLAEMIQTFCGGTPELTDFLEAPAAPASAANKPVLAAESFRQLDLRVGRVLRAERLADLPALAAVSVHLDREVEALALSSALPADPVGQHVVVAAGLHPLPVGRRTFTAYLPAAAAAEGAKLLQTVAAIPDGKKLY